MKATRILSIIQLVIAGLFIICFYSFGETYEDLYSLTGWGVILWAIAVPTAIVAIVQSKK